jgi:hypothetical protein
MDEVALPKNWDNMTVLEHLKVTFDGQQFLVMEENLPGKIERYKDLLVLRPHTK